MTNLTLTAKLKSGTELCLYDGEIDSWIWAEGYGLKNLLTISNPVKVEICNNFRYPHNIVFNDMEDLLCFIKEKSYETENELESIIQELKENKCMFSDVVYLEENWIEDYSDGEYWLTGDESDTYRYSERILISMD